MNDEILCAQSLVRCYVNARYGAAFIAGVVMSTVCPVNQVEIGHFCGRFSVFYVLNFDPQHLDRCNLSQRLFHCMYVGKIPIKF